MTSSPYQVAGSVRFAAVMAGLVVTVPTQDNTMRSIPMPNHQISAAIRSPYVLGNAGSTIRVDLALTGDPVVDNYRPRTALGRKLLILRRAYVASGGQLLDSTELDTEVQLRRGGKADA